MKTSDQRIWLAFAVAIGLFISAIFVSNSHIVQLSDDVRSVNHTYEVLLELKSILFNIESVELVKQSFIVSGDAKDIQSYSTILKEIDRLLKELHYRTKDNPIQQKRIFALELLISQRISNTNQAIELRKQKGFEAARDFYLKSPGEQMLNNMKLIEEQLENEETILLKQRYEKEKLSRQLTLPILNCMICLAFIVFFTALVQIFEEIKTRRKAEQEARLAQAELIEIQKQIKQAEIFLDSIIENIPNMVFVKDAKELRFVRFNKAGEELIGIPREKMIGRNDYDFFPKEEADFFTKKDIETLIKPEPVDIPEETIHTKNGKKLLHTKKVRIPDEDGYPKYLLGISEDVTDIKKAEKKLKETLIELERSNKELEQFAYVASHDLQEPLRVIASFCQLLEKRYQDKLDDQAKEYINYAVDGSKRMQVMVDDLLSYARVGKNTEKKDVDLNKVLKTVLSDLNVRIKESLAVIHVGPLPTIPANPTQMAQLFQNLLTNALKFKGEKPPVIGVSAVSKGDEWEFVVTDNGIGIAPEHYDRIFIIFKQLHSKKKYSGTGIGLALCKKIVETHGGRIWVQSRIGEGTSFYFTLPAQESL